MSKNYYDEFPRLPVDKMAQSISDMSFNYNDIMIPKKYYKAQLTKSIEEVIESSVELNLIDTYFRTLEKLKKENDKWFFQALLCLDSGVKPSSMSNAEYQAMELTYLKFTETKKAKILDTNWLEEFKNISENGATYTYREEESE